jgi:hypothetical protein
MLYSRANLLVARVASDNPYDGALHGVALERDGGTVASNGRVILAVGPAGAGVQFPDVGERASVGEGVVLRPELVEEALKIIPKDKRLSLQHVALTVARDPSKVEFCTIDKAGKERRIADLPKKERFPDWRKVAAKARGSVPKAKVCLARRDLVLLLRTMEEAAPDAGNDAKVFLEVGGEGGGLVLRTVNRATGQHVLGVASGVRLEGGAWLPCDTWEGDVLDNPAHQAVLQSNTKRRYYKR